MGMNDEERKLPNQKAKKN